MDIGKSLTFVFDDERWVSKLAIAAGVLLLGIVGSVIIIGPFLASAILMGYMVAIARNVMRGDERPLPEWSGMGAMFVDGIKLLIVQLVWALPFILLVIPVFLIAAAGNQGDTGQVLAAILSMCVGCVAFLYAILLVLAWPVWIVRLAETGNLGDALNLRRVVAFTRDNLAHVIVVLLVTIIVQLLSGFVGFLLCGIGLLVTAPWSYMVRGHLAGQLGLAGGADPEYGYVPPSYDEPPPFVPEDLPDDREMVDDVLQKAEQARTGWDEQAVRLDEPTEPLVWDDADAPVTPDAPSTADAPAPVEAPPTPDMPPVPDAPQPMDESPPDAPTWSPEPLPVEPPTDAPVWSPEPPPEEPPNA